MVDRPALANYLPEFEKRINKVLWNRGSGKTHVEYDNFKARVAELEANSGYNHGQAVVTAAKEFPVLHKLFRDYDIREFNPNPESHPEIHYYGGTKKAGEAIEAGDIIMEDTELSYRENLQWAMGAAGKFAREKRHPGVCPNDTAWFLYEMAISEPDKFLMRVGQVEVKASDADEQRATSRASRRSIAELNRMLEDLDYKPEESTHAPSEPSQYQGSEEEEEESPEG